MYRQLSVSWVHVAKTNPTFTEVLMFISLLKCFREVLIRRRTSVVCAAVKLYCYTPIYEHQ